MRISLVSRSRIPIEEKSRRRRSCGTRVRRSRRCAAGPASRGSPGRSRAWTVAALGDHGTQGTIVGRWRASSSARANATPGEGRDGEKKRTRRQRHRRGRHRRTVAGCSETVEDIPARLRNPQRRLDARSSAATERYVDDRHAAAEQSVRRLQPKALPGRRHEANDMRPDHLPRRHTSLHDERHQGDQERRVRQHLSTAGGWHERE